MVENSAIEIENLYLDNFIFSTIQNKTRLRRDIKFFILGRTGVKVGFISVIHV